MSEANEMPRLKELYRSEIQAQLKDQFSYTNVHQIPTLDKIVINMGVGDGVNDRKTVETAAVELTKIAGQRPVITRAKKSVATFKLREGMQVGCN